MTLEQRPTPNPYEPPSAPLVEDVDPKLRRYQHARIALLLLLGAYLASNLRYVLQFDLAYPVAIGLILVLFFYVPGTAFYYILRRSHLGYLAAVMVAWLSVLGPTNLAPRGSLVWWITVLWALAVGGLGVYAARGFFGQITLINDPAKRQHP